jgi:beta-phosphoglucomutase-like phosphatase (HAD superfamily)
VSVNNCVLIAGSQSGVAGAEQIGMPCVVLRSR